MDPHVDDGQLNALLDGELDAAERRAVETHLAACSGCRARYEEARAFLAGASDLLGMLDAPAAPAQVPAAAPPVRRAAPTAQEPSVAAPGPGVARTAKEKAVDPAARVARTGKERAVEVPPAAPAAPTAEVPALPADLPTAKSPAVRPLFGQAQRAEEEAPATRPWWRVSNLAAAAMLVVGLGAGWMANEALRRPRPPTDLAAAPSGPEARRTRDTAAAPAAEAPPPSTAAVARRSTTTARPALVKPRPMRGDKPPTADEAAARVPRERPPTAPAGELATGTRDAAGAAGAGIAGLASRPTTAGPTLAATPTPAPAAPQPARVATQAPLGAAAPTRAADEATPTPTTFQRITMDEAVRRLSGSIRLIDGLQPGRVEVGPGRLVPGAAPEREVIRVYYADGGGHRLVLDQQPGDAPAAASVNGLMRGDTLITSQPDGSVRVRWVDRKSFWLSLTGTGAVDSVRAMVERIR